MERTELATALREAAPAVWERIGPHTEGLPAQTWSLVDRAITELLEAVSDRIGDGEVSDAWIRTLEHTGHALSRQLSWDVIDEINVAYAEVAVDVLTSCGAAAPGPAARAAIDVSDRMYDGFWVFNNSEGLEQALRLGALIDHFPSPAFMLDEFGAITFANYALCELLHMSVGELDGRKLEDLVRAEGSILDEAVGEVVTLDADSSERYHRLTLSRIETAERTEYFGQLIDRTDEVRLERTKEQVIATISHELRTPLTAVVGYAQLVHDAGEDAEVDEGEAIEVIYEQATHLLTLVTDLVDFAKLDTGRIKLTRAEVDVRSIVEAVLRRVGVAERADVTLRVPHRLHLYVDRVRFEQLLTNLLTNADRYGGSDIQIEAWPTRRGTVSLRVSDDGAGVPMADRARIFETFYQGDKSHVGVGSGMGLAICRAIVHAHDGTIALEDRPGASFLIELPAAR